ncbi:MAG: hypothetical protein H3Z52_14560 [archaeon]|nr:hypothetical protein [archaeon]
MMMQKRIRKILTISLILSMILPAILVSYASAAAEAPKYSVGDKWEYRIEYLDSGISGTITREIVGESVVPIDAEQYQCFKINIRQFVQYDTSNFSMDMNVYLLKSGLSEGTNLTVVKEDYQLERNGVIRQISNITYGSPDFLKELDFTLTVGKNWNVSTMKTETDEFPYLPPPYSGPFTETVPFSRNFSVVRTERVSVPKGTFDTYVIRYETPDGIYEEYYSPTVGGYVRESVYDKSWNEEIRIELLDYKYARAPTGVLLDWWVWLAIGVVAVVAIVSVIFFVRRGKVTPAPT